MLAVVIATASVQDRDAANAPPLHAVIEHSLSKLATSLLPAPRSERSSALD
jgi:hypothetical protein